MYTDSHSVLSKYREENERQTTNKFKCEAYKKRRGMRLFIE